MTDTKTGERNASATSQVAALMPPHLVVRNFLESDTVAALLDYALAHESQFAPTMIGDSKGRDMKPDVRFSVGTRALGPFNALLKDKLRIALPDLAARLRATAVEDPKFELQLVAHNDGAFYKRHIDTHTSNESRRLRILSGVYYFHARPKAFTGGALRLYAIGDPEHRRYTDIAPEHNTLLVFPSWAPHEVMPVACPSKRFGDSRFAINCWAYRRQEAS